MDQNDNQFDTRGHCKVENKLDYFEHKKIRSLSLKWGGAVTFNTAPSSSKLKDPLIHWSQL